MTVFLRIDFLFFKTKQNKNIFYNIKKKTQKFLKYLRYKYSGMVVAYKPRLER